MCWLNVSTAKTPIPAGEILPFL